MNTKQVIVVRSDLNMRRGKEAAQVAHASMMFLTKFWLTWAKPSTFAFIDLTEPQRHWLSNSFTKICLSVDSEQALFDIHDAALENGVEAHLCRDNGTTEFGGKPTYTCLALGPDVSEVIDEITGHLKLR